MICAGFDKLVTCLQSEGHSFALVGAHRFVFEQRFDSVISTRNDHAYS